MSAIKDAILAMKEVMLLADKVDRAGALLSEISRELRDHDNRLVRLETLVEVAKSQGTRSIKSD
jgi:thioredoxin-like negative regulator of GroEL